MRIYFGQEETKFKIPSIIDRYIKTLASIYRKNEKNEIADILYRATIQLFDDRYDNWNGGQYFFNLEISIPEDAFLRLFDNLEYYKNDITAKLNEIIGAIANEFISSTIFTISEDNSNHKMNIDTTSNKRIWGNGAFKVFLSHKASIKEETAQLKEALRHFGISAFVAHADIEPATLWQNEIEKALFSMDSLVALLTKDFHDSSWTDQEIGVSFGREIPIIAVRLGSDPYGFISKFQGLSGSMSSTKDIVELALNISSILFNEDRTRNKMFNTFITTLKSETNWDNLNITGQLLGKVTNFSIEQVHTLIELYNDNSTELRNSFAFNGKYPNRFGDGLRSNLQRITGEKYSIDKSSKIIKAMAYS